MADASNSTSDWLARMPSFTLGGQAAAPPPPQPGNWLTSGLKSGAWQLEAGVGHTIQAAGTALGVPDVIQGGLGKRLGDTASEWAQKASRPDIEALPWYHPERIAYGLAQALPTLGAAMVGGGALEAVPALAGAGTLASAARAAPFMIPGAVGSNVEEETATHGGELSQGGAAKALALGVPEGAAMGFMPGRLNEILAKGAAGGLAKRALTGAATMGAYQGVLGAGQTAITQQAYTPDMPAPERARAIVDSALSGATQGAVFGGALSAIRPRMMAEQGKNPSAVGNADLASAVDTAVPPLQLTDQRGNRPMPVTPNGQAGENLRATDIDLQTRAGLKAQTPVDPNAPALLPAPTPVAQMSDGDLAARADELRGKALRPARGAIPAGLGRLQTAEYAEVNQEIWRRTPPGAEPGIGFTTYTPEEADARAPGVDTFKQSVLSSLAGQDAMRAAKHPFIQTLNATDAPEMVNSLKAQLADFDERGKTPPKWFEKIANQYGVMKGDQDAPAPAEVVTEIEGKLRDVQQAVETSRNAQNRMQLATRFKALTQQLDAARGIADLHDEAAKRLEALKAPAEPVAAPTEAVTAPVAETPAEVAPEAAIPHWEQYAQDHPEVTAAPEGLEPNLTAPDGGRVLRDLTGEEAKLPPAETHVEPPVKKPLIGKAVERPPTIPGDMQHSNPKEVQGAVDKIKQLRDDQRTQLQAIHDAEPAGSPRQQFAARALEAEQALPGKLGDPNAVAKALRTLSIQDEIDGRTARAATPLTQAEEQGVKSPKEEPPSWAQSHANDLAGDVVYHDADFALVRGRNAFGKDVYVPVDRASGKRATQSVDSAKVPWLTEPVKAKLTAARDQFVKSQVLHPDGPFKDATAKVIGTPQADPRVVSYVSGLMRSLGMGNLRVLVVHPDDVRGQTANDLGLNGEYTQARMSGMRETNDGSMNQFGPNGQDFYVHLRPGMSPAKTIETAAHEVGHIVERVALRNASGPTTKAVTDAYNDYYRSTSGATMQDIVRMTRNRAMSEEVNDPSFARPVDDAHLTHFNYLRGFPEWFADNVSRWATTAEKPLSVLDKFFASVAQRMKELITAVTGRKFLPNDAVKDFLDHMAQTPDNDMSWLAQKKMTGGQLPLASEGERAAQAMPDMEKDVGDYIKSSEDVFSRGMKALRDGTVHLSDSIRRGLLGWESGPGLADINIKTLPAGKEHWDATQLGARIEDAKNKVNVAAMRPFLDLPEKVRVAVQQYWADLQASPGLNPERSWADHTKLHDVKNAAALMARHAELVRSLDRVRTMGGKEASDMVLLHGQTLMYQHVVSQMMRDGENYARAGTPLEGFEQSPSVAFRDMGEAHDDPVLANKFYREAADKLLAGINKRIAETDAAAAAFKGVDPKQYKALYGSIADLRATSRLVKIGMEQAESRTYIPLKRGTGDFFVSGKFAMGADGKVKPEAVEAFRAALDKADFHNVGLFQDSEQSTIMTRLESRAQMEDMLKVFHEMAKQGHIDETGEKIKGGYPDQLNTMQNLGSKYMQRMMEAVTSLAPDGVDEKDLPELKRVKNIVARGLLSQWMDMLPDHSLAKSLRPRMMVHGYDTDMAKGMALYMHGSARATTSIETAGLRAAAAQKMHTQVQDLKETDPVQSTKAQDVAREILLREAQQSWRVSNHFLDGLQAGMHSIVIGFNIPYVLTANSQIMTLGHPELSKTHGYARSAIIIGKATGRAFNTMKAVFASPDAWNVGFRQDALEKGGVSRDDIKTIMQLDHDGQLSNSTFTRSVTDMGDKPLSKWEKAKDMANALGTYSEMLPRVIMALAAKDAYRLRPVKGLTEREFVRNTVKNSQFEWGPGSSSRMTGKHGPLGAYSKIALAFSQYHTKMVEKLYKEFHAAFSKGSTPEESAAGKQFLMAHAVAITALAGTLGLPAASAVAGAADKIAYWATGRDDIDVEGQYRTWLAHTFGAEAGDVLAKGLPRALGIDLSHLGDQNLLPGTGILTDKRKFEDAEKDWYKSMAGSAAGELGNLILGARDFYNGDFMLGAMKMLPDTFKAPLEAAYAAQHGYINRSGDRYPVQPSGADIAKMALGFDPTNLSQYEEANKIKTGLLAQRQYRLQNINQHILRAMQTGDNDAVRAWMQEGAKYQMDHPGMGGPVTSMSREAHRHLTQSVQARAMGAPLGVKPLDFSLRDTLGFLNPGR